MDSLQTIHLGRLQIAIEQDENSVLYTLRGDVDENFTYKKIPVIEASKITLNLEGIRAFNSCGIREWVFFMREFNQHANLFFESCSIIMMDQFNVVPQTLGPGKILSFYAPYYCPNCDEEVSHLLKVSEHVDDLTNKQAPEIKHEKCGTTMEFDALEDCYFLQLSRSVKKVS